MIKDIDIEAAISIANGQFIDLRSPAEYNETPIPGAINIPLLLDDERAIVGTIYRHLGSGKARQRGLQMVGPRLAEMIGEIEKIAAAKEIILYCWRGGDRSNSVAQVLNIMGVNGYRLNGGYRAYRNLVVKRLGELPQGTALVVHGLTGTGKTNIIQELERIGYPAVDLEGLANHRGSVFGGVGLGEQPSQKYFDSRLNNKLQEYERFPYVIVESESKKIGRLFLPDHLFGLMKTGCHILVYDTLENRIKRLYDEYVESINETKSILLSSLQGLSRHMGKDKLQELSELIVKGEYNEAIGLLLVEYYDPLYGYDNKPDNNYDLSIDGGNSRKAAETIAAWIDETLKGGRQLARSR